MAVIIILMLIAGVCLSIVVSDPNQVTLRWLRLGGLIGLGLTAVAAVVAWKGGQNLPVPFWADMAITFLLLLAQTVAAGRGERSYQRLAAGLAIIAALETICAVSGQASLGTALFADGNEFTWPYAWAAATSGTANIITLSMVALSAGVFGGFLMAMFLGHAYLTADGEMTQSPFKRLVVILALLLVARLGVSLAYGLWPYLQAEEPELGRKFNLILITARYLVGMVIPCVLTYMIYDCVRRRSNQSATGILYVAVVILVIGEGLALSLLSSTGFVF